MRKYFLLFIVLLGFAFVQQVKAGVQKTLTLPAAAAHADVISLGTAKDPQSGKVVTGYAFIHRKDSAAKKSGSSSCYTYLSRGAKWKSVEPWVVNPTNTRGLLPDFVEGNLAGDIAKWENAAGIAMLGSGSITSETLIADTLAPDGVNEVYFAPIDNPGVIAVTIVWGIFSGPMPGRELVEWDQVYDDVHFDWSSSGEPAKMDFENIATHELGHSVGMGDLYTSGCTQETMYGYASEGETIKRDLHTGDITGISQLY